MTEGNRPLAQVLRSPSDFLKLVIGQPVVVRLHSGADYQDGYMNIALEQAEEWICGIRHRTYGDAFIRGNNGTGYPYFAVKFLSAVY